MKKTFAENTFNKELVNEIVDGTLTLSKEPNGILNLIDSANKYDRRFGQKEDTDTSYKNGDVVYNGETFKQISDIIVEVGKIVINPGSIIKVFFPSKEITLRVEIDGSSEPVYMRFDGRDLTFSFIDVRSDGIIKGTLGEYYTRQKDPFGFCLLKDKSGNPFVTSLVPVTIYGEEIIIERNATSEEISELELVPVAYNQRPKGELSRYLTKMPDIFMFVNGEVPLRAAYPDVDGFAYSNIINKFIRENGLNFSGLEFNNPDTDSFSHTISRESCGKYEKLAVAAGEPQGSVFGVSFYTVWR